MLQRLKKIISALTVTAMIFGIMPIGAFAENLNKADYEELNDGYLKVVVSAKNGGFYGEMYKNFSLREIS